MCFLCFIVKFLICYIWQGCWERYLLLCVLEIFLFQDFYQFNNIEVKLIIIIILILKIINNNRNKIKNNIKNEEKKNVDIITHNKLQQIKDNTKKKKIWI